MAKDLVQTQLLYFNDIPTKLGLIQAVGMIENGAGTERGVLRVYGSYALVYVFKGNGDYYDANGYRHHITPGDFVLVTPDLPHRYSTKPGQYWSEYYIVFDGPVFDLCRKQGVFNPARPVSHQEPIQLWLDRLASVVAAPDSHEQSEKTAQVSRLLALLMDIFDGQHETADILSPAAWLAKAKSILDGNLERDIALETVAQDLAVSYETFRKGFQKQFGVSPALYRTQRRLAAACRLLEMTTMTHQRIAAHLGFSDEFHFSKRFKQLMGVSPREYRGRTSNIHQ